MRLDAGDLAATGPHLSVGLHAADPLALGTELERLRGAGIGMIHLDVMDGVFCPQMTFGPQVVRAVDPSFIKDVHLMLDDPLAKLEWFVDAGASMITFHLEGTRHPRRALQSLAGSGVLRGVAIGPGMPIQALEPLIDDLELVLLVTIDPGWPGQRLDPHTAGRVAALRGLLGERRPLIGIDGAVNRANIGTLASLGADVVVSGSAIFEGADPAANARSMLEALRAGSQGPVPVLAP